jgi:hypothetical protein
MTNQLRSIRGLSLRGYKSLKAREEAFSKNPSKYYRTVVRPQLREAAALGYMHANVELEALTPEEANAIEEYTKGLGFTVGQFQPEEGAVPEDDRPQDWTLPVEWLFGKDLK